MATESIVKIELWNRKYKDDFVRLNRDWITKYFNIEEHDIEIFANPEEIILSGGEIFFATINDFVVGCCALVYHKDKNMYELAKMAVDSQFQGSGIGYQLGITLLNYAKKHGIKSIFGSVEI